MGNSYKDLIKNFSKSLGLDVVGFTSCRVFDELRDKLLLRKKNGTENEFEEKDVENRVNPFIYMEEGKTIISIAFPYLHNKIKNKKVYFSKYTMGRDYHFVVLLYLKRICEYIEELGGKAICLVDSNALPERYIAKKSGIGFIGKNNMLINPIYGSYIFLGEIITNIEIEPDVEMKNKCDECNKCRIACPTGALDNNNFNLCLSYITQKKFLDDNEIKKMGGRIFGCDTCQDVCPFNKDIKFSTLKEFKPFDFMQNIDIDELININKVIFTNKYKLTSSSWRGKNLIQRNALISAFNLNMDIQLQNLKFNSPYVEEYYKKLLKIYK